MWLPITIITMLFYAMTEIIGKKTVSAEKEFNILKLRISAILVDAVLLTLLWVFYYRGTGTNPWLITVENPLIILGGTLNVVDVFFYLQALKFIGLTVQEAYSGVSSILLFVEMIFINLVFGKIDDVRIILVPAKLIIIVVLLTASFVLPRLNGAIKNEASEIFKQRKRNVVLGLLFTFAGLFLDAIESLITTYSFSESDISSIDYLSAGLLVALFWGVIFYAILYFKSRKIFNPLKKTNLIYIFYGVFNAVFIALCLYGASLAPVESNLFWVAYPIIPIIGSALFLKERYSIKEYICIAVIAISSMAFALSDYFI